MKKLVVLLGIVLLFITGCSNDTFNKAVEQGKLAIASKEYDKALASFQLALDEKKDDKDTKTLYEQTKEMVQAIKSQSDSKVDDAIKSFEQVEKTSGGSDTLKMQAKDAREALVAQKQKQDQYNNQLAKADELKGNQKYAEAKDILNTIVTETKDKDYLKAINQKATEMITAIDQEVAKVESDKAAAEAKKKEEEAKVADAVKQKQQQQQQQVAFTGEQAVSYAKKKYDDSNGDTLYSYSTDVKEENGKKYYQVFLKSKSMQQAGGNGNLFFVKVFEDGTIIE
ncbi:hypothetical protein [Ectobacillus sp. sgz5001026]|uniref:hypothetical protein n=1 Tax=Ectobacillus sp. sgz5001026 TaxID=3242473 RepID=UPI0036D43E04